MNACLCLVREEHLLARIMWSFSISILPDPARMTRVLLGSKVDQ